MADIELIHIVGPEPEDAVEKVNAILTSGGQVRESYRVVAVIRDGFGVTNVYLVREARCG